MAGMKDTVRARIDRRLKKDARAVLQQIGLTESDAFRMMMRRIAVEKQLPFAPLIPNQTTIDAMEEARRGGLRRFANAAEMLAALNDEEEEKETGRRGARGRPRRARRSSTATARR